MKGSRARSEDAIKLFFQSQNHYELCTIFIRRSFHVDLFLLFFQDTTSHRNRLGRIKKLNEYKMLIIVQMVMKFYCFRYK